MSKQADNRESRPPSKIFLDECFASEDDRFVDELKKFQSPKLLVSFVENWLVDRRPWAREQIVRYLEGELNLPGHEVVFKRIFKHFRHASDHDMMGVLMVTLDRIVRRSRVTQYHYDWSTRRSWSTERLFAKPNKSIIQQTGRFTEGTYLGRAYKYPLPDLVNKSGNQLFSHKTRNHLRRSAWRYFRYLSYREPEDYVKSIASALARYRDLDFWVGENIIDNWSLMHACYFHDTAITFTASHTNLAEGGSLERLSPKPYQPEVWKSETARNALIELLVNAQSTLVRIWAIEMFLQEHESEIGTIELTMLVKMLSSSDPHLQEFAHKVFDGHPALPTLTVQKWLELLDSSSVNLLPLICDSMKKNVSEERLDGEQLIELTSAKQVPVAALGLELSQSRHKRQPFSMESLMRLADCQCAQQADPITHWAIDQICSADDYHADHVIDFFDALLRPTRNAAVQWLQLPEAAGYNDAMLWARLIETPFDDVKFQLIELLNRRSSQPGLESDQLAAVWVAVILGVHRGGRTKPKAINQLTDQIHREPARADSLLPVLAVAIRSVRAPEMRTGLAAVVRLATSSAELRSKIRVLIPELEFPSDVSPEEVTT